MSESERAHWELLESASLTTAQSKPRLAHPYPEVVAQLAAAIKSCQHHAPLLYEARRFTADMKYFGSAEHSCCCISQFYDEVLSASPPWQCDNLTVDSSVSSQDRKVHTIQC